MKWSLKELPAILSNLRPFAGAEPARATPMGDDGGLDLEDRDPKRLNQHAHVLWEEVIGEPDGPRSPECAWRLSKHCFRLSRSCCYVLLTVVAAPVLALLFGLAFACLAFERVWCIGPCLRVWRALCSAIQQFWGALLQALVRPFSEALGYALHHVRVRSQRLPDALALPEDPHLLRLV